MTSTPFLIGVAVGAVGAWFWTRRSANGGGGGIGGPGGGGRRMGRHAHYSGLGRYR